jgi:fucose permease
MLFVPFLRMNSLDPLFFTFQGAFLLLLAWVFFRERQEAGVARSALDAAQPQSPAPLRFLLPLVVMALCAVGVDSALSGWLTTYSRRADPGNAGGAVLATSLFWFAIMLSRLAFSTRLLAYMGRRRVLHTTLWGTAASVALLIAAHGPATIRIAAAAAGLCIGPLYPLLLSFLLERSARGWIFAVAGLGSAFFPWLTGVLSAHYGSLRYGLIAPCAAALLMIVLLPLCFRSVNTSRLSASPHS